MIRNIIFDLGGVILHLDPQKAEQRFRELGVTNASEMMSIYAQGGLFGELEQGKITNDEFRRRLALIAKGNGLFKDEENPIYSYEQTQWGWLGYVKEVPQYKLDYLENLKKNYRLFLLSNTNDFLMSWAKTSEFSESGNGIGHYFEKMYCSYEMKDYKPAKSIYLKMMEDGGMKPNECLFLDDSEKNVEGAKSLGINTILVENNGNWIPQLENTLGKLNI